MTRRNAPARAFLIPILLLASFLGLAAQAQDQGGQIVVGYLLVADDPRYEPQRAYTGLRLKDRKRPLPGAEVALREARVIGRALGLRFELREVEVAEPVGLAEAIRRLRQEDGARFFLVDADAAALRDAARALADEPILLFNVTETDDALRGADCAANLLHVIPSRAMLMDALAQYLASKHWRDVLLLQGPEPEDSVLAEAFARSAGKFGLTIVARRDFVLGQDPRERDRNNIALMTASPESDVVFLADSLGEFGRYVAYQTARPRPVVGSEGLGASAWHWTWERHGAPQLNQRFEKHAGRTMEPADWAAWAAVKGLVEAAARTRSADFTVLAEFLRGPDFTLDAYKGTPASYRAWDNQLRQPILLHTHNAVIERAPLPGFLHARENMDTLGFDKPDSPCRF